MATIILLVLFTLSSHHRKSGQVPDPKSMITAAVTHEKGVASHKISMNIDYKSI